MTHTLSSHTDTTLGDMRPNADTLEAVARLVSLYCSADEDTRQRGRDWYPTMRRIVARIARETGTPVRRAVATAAITSPDAQLATNVAWTRTACANHAAKVGRYPNTMAARYGRILRGEIAPERGCGGLKVRSFYRAILGDTDAVVLDRWALRVAGHHRDTATDLQYARIAEIYRIAAAVVGETARDLQAILWTQARDGHRARLTDVHDLIGG